MNDATRFVFVGERPSERAAQIGATWQNGRLSAKNLREAIAAAGFDPDRQFYLNLWATPGVGPLGMVRDHDELAESSTTLALVEHLRVGRVVVALGALVASTLRKRGIPHLRLTHPAARGAIRKTECYREHVRGVLSGSAPACVPSERRDA